MTTFMDFLANMPVLWAAFVGCTLGSFIPIIHTELLVLGIVTLAPGEHGLPMVLVATTGTMLGKTVLYFAGRGLVKLPIRKREKVDGFLARAEQRPAVVGSVLFASAASGFPPFYVVTVASGMIRYSLITFLVVGFLGRFLRFSLVVFVPQFMKTLIH